MKTILSSLLSLLFTTALFAQCGSHPTPGFTPAGALPITSNGCNEISAGPITFLSMSQAPSEANGGPLTPVWNNVPQYVGDPSTYQGLFVIGASQVQFQVPGTVSPACSWVVSIDIVFNLSVPVGPGCTSTPIGVLPPLAGLQGFTFYTQGLLWDLTQNTFTVTKPFAFTVQP